jgi:copper transport protein
MTIVRHWVRRYARRACGLLGALAVAGIALAVMAPAASAHATLLFTSPAADSAVPVSPAAITLTFNEQVTLVGTPVTLAGPGGRKIALGAAREGSGRSVVTVPVTSQLPDGVYTVSWQVISADGDLVGSQYEFAVGPAPASLGSAAAAAPSTPGQWPLVAARWLLFAGLAAALGGLAGRGLAMLYRDPPGPLPGPWALRASLFGFAAAGVLATLQLGGGSLSAGLAHLSAAKLLSSGPGRTVAVEVAAFAIAAVLLRLRWPGWAVLPLLAVVTAEGARAHPGNVAGVGGALLTWVHLLAAALWAGMLLYVVRAGIAWREHPKAVRALVRLYSRVAAWLFALIVVTGVVSALVLVPLRSLFTTHYGWVLIVKAGLVGVAAVLAVAGRRWLRRSPAPGAGPALATRIEAGTLAGVLAVAALLTTVAAPSLASSGGALPFPPPASGPLVPLGGRAGEVGIYATASAGQIVVHLAAPEESGPGGPQFTISMTLAGLRGTASALPVRGCGPGCFVASARWVRGDNLLTLRAAASGWTGGTASLDVPWPPAADATLLSRALAAMRQVRAVTVYEQVTSDTALGAGTPHSIGISGPAFLAGEPYAGGVVPVAGLVAGSKGQQQVLLLGFPGSSVWVELTLGAGDRIAHEVLVDPDHLINRGFAYPEK